MITKMKSIFKNWFSKKASHEIDNKIITIKADVIVTTHNFFESLQLGIRYYNIDSLALYNKINDSAIGSHLFHKYLRAYCNANKITLETGSQCINGKTLRHFTLRFK